MTLQLPEFWGRFADLLYLVPGGRYLVTISLSRLGIWDLRYVSDGDVGNRRFGCRVHLTPNGLGIRILTPSHPLPYTDFVTLYIFEICLPKGFPGLAKIAKRTLSWPQLVEYSLNGNTIVIRLGKGTVIVWDFVAKLVD
ncbi:hypothetical protein BYT27DRAFT_7216069 [Phlegmacium glaucopus]|nr:hypothetical protein BYT27DRAFT_7216069 [Phlegmacium glaucopus]